MTVSFFYSKINVYERYCDNKMLISDLTQYKRREDRRFTSNWADEGLLDKVLERVVLQVFRAEERFATDFTRVFAQVCVLALMSPEFTGREEGPHAPLKQQTKPSNNWQLDSHGINRSELYKQTCKQTDRKIKR